MLTTTVKTQIMDNQTVQFSYIHTVRLVFTSSRLVSRVQKFKWFMYGSAGLYYVVSL
jgi:hypothetical protein